jgi:hypothetical protein
MKSICLLLLALVYFITGDGFKVKGQYKVVFSTDTSKQQWQSYVINFVNDSVYKSIKPGGFIANGKITRYANTVYLVDTATYHPQGHLDNTIYQSFGKHTIEFNETGKDTLKFRTTYSANLRVTLNDGMLVKIK